MQIYMFVNYDDTSHIIKMCTTKSFGIMRLEIFLRIK